MLAWTFVAGLSASLHPRRQARQLQDLAALCGLDSCHASQMAGDYSCGARIEWLQTEEGGSRSEADACATVAGEFSVDCGGCVSLSPPPVPSPPPAPPAVASPPPAPYPPFTASALIGANAAPIDGAKPPLAEHVSCSATPEGEQFADRIDRARTDVPEHNFPTNTWWTNLVLENDDDYREAMVIPYMLRYTSGASLLEWCTTRVTDNENWIVTVVSHSCVRLRDGPFRVTSYAPDKLSFSMASPCVATNVVRGSPYVELRVAASSACLATLPAEWEALPEASLRSVAGWGVQWRSAPDGARVYRFAHGTFDATEQTFSCVAVAPSMEVQMQTSDRAVISIDWGGRTWDGAPCATPRVVALPSHVEALELGSGPVYKQVIDRASLDTMKGTLRVVEGAWDLAYDLLDTSQFLHFNAAPREGDTDTSVEDAVADELRTLQCSSNRQAYGGGQLVYALASVIEVAASLPTTDPALLAEAVERLKGCLGFWFSGTPEGGGPWGFFYDTTFGGVLGQTTCTFANFGNYLYNDHAFHYGYFIHAAAVVALHDSDGAWTEAAAPFVLALIRDVANPSFADNHFPFLRYQDTYLQYGLAHGMGYSPKGKNRESTSEEMHAWFGIALYGHARSDARLRDLGRFGLATTRASSLQWYLFSQDTSVYSGAFRDSQNVVGILKTMQAQYSTFFGWEYTYPIHLSVPFTPITPWYVCQSWVRASTQKLRSWSEPTETLYGVVDGKTASYDNIGGFWRNGYWQTYALGSLEEARSRVGTYVPGEYRTTGTMGFDCSVGQTATCTTLFASLRHLAASGAGELRC